MNCQKLTEKYLIIIIIIITLNDMLFFHSNVLNVLNVNLMIGREREKIRD